MEPISFDYMKRRYGLDVALRYQAILDKPTPKKAWSHKPWYSPNPRLTPGMVSAIRRQYQEGNSPSGIAQRWAVSTNIIKQVLGIPIPPPPKRRRKAS